MQSQTLHEETSNGFWRGLLTDWFSILTEPNLDRFRIQKTKSDILKAVVGIGIFGLVFALWSLIFHPATMPISTGNAFLDLLLVMFFAEADFFILSLIFYVIAKAFGGHGNFADQSYLLSLVAAPMGIIIIAFLFISHNLGLTLATLMNPLSPTGIAGIIMLLFALYGLLLVLFALQACHEMAATAVVYTLGIPIIIWGFLRVISMFVTGEENVITTVWAFVMQQWEKGAAQELLLGHLWLVFFSVVIAIIIGVIMGVFITWPSKRPRISHLLILIPLGIGLILWAASAGMFNEDLALQINQTVKTWDRSMTRVDSLFFSPMLDIVAAIISKPDAVGMITMVFTLILYSLYLAGEKASELTLYIAGIILTIPSVALFGVLIKPLGIGPFNAAFALILYAQLPILRNTYTGIKAVAPEIIEAGRGMGMSELQLLIKVKLPMAIPVIVTGVRVSVVMLIGITAIAAYIGNDTLGEYIFSGIQRAQEKRYIAGAIMVAILALAVDILLGWIQNVMTPEGLKGRRESA